LSLAPSARLWLAYACLASSMAVVGSYVALSKTLILIFPLFVLAGLRFGIAAVAMVGWVRRGNADLPLDARDRRLLFAESFFGNFLFSICMLGGMALTSALAAGVIMAAMPAVVALLSWWWLGERITRRVAAAIACAVGGIAMVSLSRHADAQSAVPFAQALLGNLLLVGAVTCESIYVVIGKKLAAKVSPKRISALINLWGLALVAPFALWQARAFDFQAVDAGSWTLLVFYSLAASTVTVWLWMTGLRHVPASRAGVFTVMLPVSTAAVGVLFLGEHFSSVQAFAYSLALAGVVLATWPGGSADSSPSPAGGRGSG
jgi:drug/metabolite transporter (DMT)-like permease